MVETTTTTTNDRDEANMQDEHETTTPAPAVLEHVPEPERLDLSSGTVGKLAAALAAAQGAFTHAPKDHVGKVKSAKADYSYNYATLAGVWDACRKPLADNGLAVLQRVLPTAPGRLRVETLLVHSSGEWISDGAPALPVSQDTAQAHGSAITYARRYGLAAIVGVAQDDDDAAGATSSSGDQAAAHGEVLEAWKWGKEKGRALADVTLKSLQWLAGQDEYGTDGERAAAAAELERRAEAKKLKAPRVNRQALADEVTKAPEAPVERENDLAVDEPAPADPPILPDDVTREFVALLVASPAVPAIGDELQAELEIDRRARKEPDPVAWAHGQIERLRAATAAGATS